MALKGANCLLDALSETFDQWEGRRTHVPHIRFNLIKHGKRRVADQKKASAGPEVAPVLVIKGRWLLIP
jgi:hypothetical protein